MKYTTRLYNTKSTAVMIPVFFADGADKREEENVRRMNGFYDELKSSVFGYTGSEGFPEGGRYFAKARVTESGEDLTVEVTMCLRQKGKQLSKRVMSHTWRDGAVMKRLIRWE